MILRKYLCTVGTVAYPSPSYLFFILFILFVSDEEIGGQYGMHLFSESKHFKDLNVGFELDESAPHTKPDHLLAFNAEKTCRRKYKYLA